MSDIEAHLDLSLLEKVKQTGGKTIARCPACAEEERDTAGDHLVIYPSGKFGCVAHEKDGEHRRRIFDLVGVKSERTTTRPAHKGIAPWEKPIERTHDYHDEAGKVLFQVVIHGRDATGKKDMGQRRPDPTKPGGWSWSLKGVVSPRPLFRLPQLLASDPAQPVWIVEGEKDADAVAGRGGVATCNPGGAGNWHKADQSPLRDRDIIISPDNDTAGRNHAEQVAKALLGVARSIRVVNWPEVWPTMPDKADIGDAFEDGLTLPDIEATALPWKMAEEPAKLSLLEQAYALRYDPEKIPPPDESCLSIGGTPIAARGNVSALQGKSKVGKSAVVSAILAAAQRGPYSAKGDTLCMEWEGEAEGKIIHLDTEQSLSDWHGLVSRSVTRSGLSNASNRIVSLPLVMFARSERLEILRQALEREHKAGGVDLVVIDGVADLCKSPNDEAEALELVSILMALSQEYHCAIMCVLHENPGTDQGKTRGHLGSELNRKAFANLRIDKDSEMLSTIYGTEMRKREIPREQGFCFAWDDAAGMHTFQGRAAGVKAAKHEAEAIATARAEWEPIYELAAENRTNGTCPVLTPEEAAELDQEFKRTKKRPTAEAMRKRMGRAETLGVLRKTSRGQWALNPNGQNGQNGQNPSLSSSEKRTRTTPPLYKGGVSESVLNPVGGLDA
jgi:hypothetical protein